MQQHLTKVTIPFIQIEPTTRCNFKCGFCSGRRMPQQDMTMGVFNGILKAFSGIRHIELQGEGEPILSPYFSSMLEKINTLESKVHVSLISIESSDADQFRALRGGDVRSVFRNIQMLITKRNQIGLEWPRVGFAVTLLRDTLPSLPAIVEIYRKLKMDGGIQFQLLQRMPQYASSYPTEVHDQFFSQEEAVLLKKMIRESFELQLALKEEKSSGGFYNALYEGSGTDWFYCPWLEKGAYIAANGTMMSCCFIKDSNKFGFGRIDKDGPLMLVRKREALAMSLQAGVIPENCHGCSLAAKASRPH